MQLEDDEIIAYDGVLQKWTNYINGWQSRYIVLNGDVMSYYKSQNDLGIGCRGAISISKAEIISHDFDHYRFDVIGNGFVWCLRTKSSEEKQQWIDKLKASQKKCLKSIPSKFLISSSVPTNPKALEDLKEKVNDLETLQKLLTTQINILETFLDPNKSDPEDLNKIVEKPYDIKEVVVTLKGISSAMLDQISECLKIVSNKENEWQEKVKENQWRIVKLEETCRALIEERLTDLPREASKTTQNEEFFDAYEDNNESNKENTTFVLYNEHFDSNTEVSHSLYPEIQKITQEQIQYAGLVADESQWQVFYKNKQMKFYRREEEIDGIVTDPIKAYLTIAGVTGKEMCHYFFRPEYRFDWETTLDKMEIIDIISDNKIVFHQLHKRTWPVTQRDALFWSHMTHIPDPQDSDGQDIWVVVNKSTSLPNYPSPGRKCIRINMTVCFYCQTLVSPPKSNEPITRDDIVCKLVYCSNINPGGWVPSAAVRAVYKKEYPKFLKHFSTYVKFQTENKPIMF